MSTHTGPEAGPADVEPHRGRQLDDTRDADIRRAALELLSECGYDRLTMEAVAARAHAGKATLYRRWPGKAELVVDAVTCMKQTGEADVDTGSLRSDLRALFIGYLGALDEFHIGLMSGLMTALKRNPDLAAAYEKHVVATKLAAIKAIFARAQARGEVDPSHDLDLLASVGPAILIHRLLLSSKPLSRHYLTRVIDEVVLPLAGAPVHRAPRHTFGKVDA